MRETFTPYPFTQFEARENIEDATFQHATDLFENSKFEGIDKKALLSSFKTYYTFASLLFNEEEELRKNGIHGANLYYHGRHHAVQQTTYDAISIAKTILNRNDMFAKHLSAEGIISIVWGAMFHDTGYVSGGPVENYATRTPIHVDESMHELATHLHLLGLPTGIDLPKVEGLGKIGIHGTHFPFTQNRLTEFEEKTKSMTPEEKKEAQIVRLSVQLADLGGQCARPDYYPAQVVNLRRELNSATPNLGDTIIGNDTEMEAKREVFLNNCIKSRQHPIKNVETTAIAFFGENGSKHLRNAWFKSRS